MGEGSGELTKAQVDKVVDRWLTPGKAGGEISWLTRAGRVAGSIRPEAGLGKLMAEHHLLDVNRENLEWWLKELAERTGKEFVPLSESLLIRESDRTISRRLEPEFLVLTRLLANKDYASHFDAKLATRLVVERWSRGVFPEGEEVPVNLEFVGKGDYKMPEELIREAIDRELQSEGRREYFVKKLLEDPEYVDVIRNQVRGVEFKSMNVDDYRTLVAESTYRLLSAAREKDRAGGVGLASITTGLELEVVNKKGRRAKQSNQS